MQNKSIYLTLLIKNVQLFYMDQYVKNIRVQIFKYTYDEKSF